VGLIDRNNSLGNSLRYNYRKILNSDEIQQNFQKFKDNVDFINLNYDRKLTELTTIEDLRTHDEILNDLHEEYEIYGDRLAQLIEVGYFNSPKKYTDLYNTTWPGDVHDKELHECMLLLNEQIHNFESIFSKWDTPTSALCSCLVDFMPAGLHEDLNLEDYVLFSPDQKWGWMYLGYNTLGKHWSSVCNDDDVEVVRRGQVRPQARFAAELYMVFRTAAPYYSQVAFHKWWEKNQLSGIHDPDMRLKDFAFGYIPVAQLSSYRLDDENEILITSDINEREWNLNVWSKFNQIINVEISRR
jgi:hypothetical protein